MYPFAHAKTKTRHADRSRGLGSPLAPQIRKFSCGRLQNLRRFTRAAARVITGVLKSKIGAYSFETLRQAALFERHPARQ